LPARRASVHEPFDRESSRAGIALAPDAPPESLATLAQPPPRSSGQASQLLRFFFGEDELVEVPDGVRRQDTPPHLREQRLMERNETVRRADAVELYT